MVNISSSWRYGSPAPFSPEDEITPGDVNNDPPPPKDPIIIPGKIDNSGATFKPIVVPGKLDSNKDSNVNTKTVFKKKIIEVAGPEKKIFAPISDNVTPSKKDGTTFKPIEYGSEKIQSFLPIDLGILTGPVVDKAIDVGLDVLKGFRIQKLPRHDADFAHSWYYSSQNELVAENVTIEYNAYLQVIKELKDNKLQLPEGFDAPTIAFDLDTYILRDFREKSIKYDPNDDLVHRAWFAHCAKRAIEALREGIFVGENGYERKYPEIADILERRINQIIVNNTLYKDEVQN